MAYVYILKSLKDSKKYIGSTIDLKRRLLQHQAGQVFSTRNRRPLVLFGYEYFETIEEASIFEKKYKKSHGYIERKIKSGKIKIDNFGV